MRDVEILADFFTYAAQGTRRVVAGLSREELIWRPDAQATVLARRSGIVVAGSMC